MRPTAQITLVFFFACLLAAASFELQAKDNLEMIEGMVVSAQAGTLVVKDEHNRDHVNSVDPSAQVMVEGKMANLEDIQTGMKAHVTMDTGKVIAVNATKSTRVGGLAR
jgi:hypothetical protein